MERAFLPHSRDTDAAVDTAGVAYALPDGSVAPFFPARMVRILTTEAAYVGWGPDDSPPAAAAGNTVYHEADLERDYALPYPCDPLITHLYVYARTAATDVFVSFFG